MFAEINGSLGQSLDPQTESLLVTESGCVCSLPMNFQRELILCFSTFIIYGLVVGSESVNSTPLLGLHANSRRMSMFITQIRRRHFLQLRRSPSLVLHKLRILPLIQLPHCT